MKHTPICQGALLWSLLMAVSMPLALRATAAPPPAPMKINVTAKPVNTRPDSPVNISWTLVSSSTTPVIASVTYYLNNQSLPGPALSPTGTAWKPGTAYPGPQNVAVVPGINEISVMLLGVHGTPTTTQPPKLTDLLPGQKPPAPPTPGAGVASSIVVFATGTARLTPAVPASTLASGLTAANRTQLMKDYAPLLLYSYDHSSDEEYAPIDVLSFIKGSTLAASTGNLPNSALQTPSVILNPSPSTAPNAGTISASLSPLPAALYVAPEPNTVQKGLPWTTVMSSQNPNTGLYGRVLLLDLKKLDTKQFQTAPDAALLAGFATRYGCNANNWTACPAQILKIEYWQFFGYSHDYQGTGDSIADSQTDHSGDWCTVQLYVDASWWQYGKADAAILAVYHYMHGIQVGFDMSQLADTPDQFTVPAPATGYTGKTYSAREYHGPNYGQSVDFPITVAGVQYGPDKSGQIASAQNNAVQLATAPVTLTLTVHQPGEVPVPTTLIPSFQHPVVYVEWGGHEFWPTSAWGYTGASKHNGLGQYSYLGSTPVDLLVDTVPLPQDVVLVTDFAGYWGAEGGGGPPQGPPLHCQWYWDPDTIPADLLAHVDVCTNQPPVKKTF